MRIAVGLILGLAAAALAAPAHACRTSQQMRSYLFASPPPLQKGEIAARVEVVSSEWVPGRSQFRGRVLTMLQGGSRARYLTFRPSDGSTCHVLPRRGAVGIAVGRVIARDGREPVVDPEISPDRLPPG